MPSTLPEPVQGRHLLRTEISASRAKQAKADLRKPEIEGWREQIGLAIERARQLRGWTLQELAREVQRDERQCARWIAGTERPQLDALFAVESFRSALVVALAQMAGDDVEVTTQITVRRSA